MKSLLLFATILAFPGLNYGQTVEHPSGHERPRICLKRFNIHLGDSFEHVDSLVDLKFDPNGPHDNNRAWEPGKFTDFFSVNEPSVVIDKENHLNPSIFCVFDEAKRLRSFSVNWLHDGEKGEAMKPRILDVLLERELPCMKGRGVNREKDVCKGRYDGGAYVEEFEFDFTRSTYWWWEMGYSITMKEQD